MLASTAGFTYISVMHHALITSPRFLSSPASRLPAPQAGVERLLALDLLLRFAR